MPDKHTIHEAAGKELDARFLVERDDRGLSVVISSSGGTPKTNPDYDDALQLILERLAAIDAELSRVEVDSKKSEKLPPEERLLALDSYPILLSAVDDLNALRRKVGRGAQKTAREPGAGGGGSPQKRLRLFLEFKKRPSPSVDDLLQIIKYGRSLDYGREIERISHTSEVAADDPTLSSWGTRTRGGQGFERDQAVREAVEERAMIAAVQHYATEQWTVKRVEHDNEGYDILCAKGTELLFVEVKGTQQKPGSKVIITRNEAEHAHNHSKRTELFILYNIRIDNNEASGTVRIIPNWDPLSSGALIPINYHWHPPAEML